MSYKIFKCINLDCIGKFYLGIHLSNSLTEKVVYNNIFLYTLFTNDCNWEEIFNTAEE